ncbi:hypothetical protein [Nonomuraea sp. NPDC050643]|uniref:hypothetical protein n=1 Tax=Nonomuraea sp. NPDC050643 TaxID=3155660 RepID=UPI0033DE1F99
MAVDRSIQIRTQEIISKSPVSISLQDAVTQALREKFGDDIAAITAYAASLSAGTMKGIRKATYNLPDDDGTLFDIPIVIAVTTPTDGDLLVPRELADTGHVRQWTREGLQHHSTQRLRFKRATKDLELVADAADGAAWSNTRASLAERKKELEAAESEAEGEE